MLYSGRIRVYINNIKDRYKAMTYYDFVAKLRINNRFIDNLNEVGDATLYRTESVRPDTYRFL